jgi:hypothetical protein
VGEMTDDPRLPSFLIIGARRAGTTSLYDYLTHHPHIAAAKKKELHFFDREYPRGIGWYRSQFPWWLRVRKAVRTGEATPYYLFHPAVPDRVKATLPDAKFIVLLRNPVDRAFSHYQGVARRGWETLSFEDAIAAEPNRLAGEAEKLAHPNYMSFAHTNLSYVSRGMYADQLIEWTARFGWDRFLIIRSEDMYADPAKIHTQTLEFLELDPIALRTYAHRNVGRWKEQIRPETRRRLQEFYRPHNQRLYELIGRDMGWER